MKCESDSVRSYIMSRVGGKNTKPELKVRQFLFANGFRYRLHNKELPGRPDIVLKNYNTVIFVHGCFWHRHDCNKATTPKTNIKFWENKFYCNTQRDNMNYTLLEQANWRIITVWECSLKKANEQTTLVKLVETIKDYQLGS